MKKAIIFLLAMMVLTPTFFGQPFYTKNMQVVFTAVEDQKAMEVRLTNISEKCTVRLIDNFQVDLFEDVYKSKMGYAKKLNLKNLPSGKYKVMIESEGWICEQPIEIVKNEIIVLEEMQNWYIIPAMEITNESIKVLTAGENVVDANHLALFNQSGDEIFAYKLINRNPKINISFDISNLDAGQYQVALYTDARTVTKTINRQ
jgi:hypothetical protein